MNKFQSLFLGATMAATTMTAVAFAPSAAMAVTLLQGTIGIDADGVDLGDLNSQPGTVVLDWLSGVDGKEGTVKNTLTGVTGNFLSFAPTLKGTRVDIKDLTLTNTGVDGSLSNSIIYDFERVNKFIEFTGNFTFDSTVGTLSFNLYEGQIMRRLLDDSVVTMTFLNPGLQGEFVFTDALGNTRTLGSGNITASEIFDNGQSSSEAGITLRALAEEPGEPVPEPLTMGGLAIGAGFGAFLKKRYSKKEKQLQKA